MDTEGKGRFGFLLAVTAGLMLNAVTASAKDNMVKREAAKVGIHKCLSAIGSVADVLIDGAKGSDIGDHYVYANKKPDKQLFSATLERDYSDGIALSSMTVAPVANGNCAAVYDKVIYWSDSCLAISRKIYDKFKYKGTLNKTVSWFESPDGGIYVYLIPAGQSGCVSMRKEVVMNVKSSK